MTTILTWLPWVLLGGLLTLTTHLVKVAMRVEEAEREIRYLRRTLQDSRDAQVTYDAQLMRLQREVFGETMGDVVKMSNIVAMRISPRWGLRPIIEQMLGKMGYAISYQYGKSEHVLTRVDAPKQVSVDEIPTPPKAVQEVRVEQMAPPKPALGLIKRHGLSTCYVCGGEFQWGQMVLRDPGEDTMGPVHRLRHSACPHL